MGEIRNKKTAEQAILEYFMDKRGRVQLSPVHQEILERVRFAHKMLVNQMSPVQAASVLEKELDIAESTAYGYVRMAIRIFGDATAADKKGMRHIVHEMTIKAYNTAEQKGDLLAMDSLIGKLIKLHGLDKEDPDMPEFDKLEPGIVIMSLPESAMEKLSALLSRGVVDLNRIEAEDAEYEELGSKRRGPDQTGNRAITQPGQR